MLLKDIIHALEYHKLEISFDHINNRELIILRKNRGALVIAQRENQTITNDQADVLKTIINRKIGHYNLEVLLKEADTLIETKAEKKREEEILFKTEAIELLFNPEIAPHNLFFRVKGKNYITTIQFREEGVKNNI